MALSPATELFDILDLGIENSQTDHKFDLLASTWSFAQLNSIVKEFKPDTYILTVYKRLNKVSEGVVYTVAWWKKHPTELDSEGNPKAIPWD